MTTLSAASNLLAPAYHLLLEKGYAVTYDPEMDWWTAEKGGVRLGAYDPLQLCGVAYVYEAKGDAWPVSDEAADAYRRLEQPQEPFYPYEDLW